MDYKEILKGIVKIISTTEKSDIGFANICTYIGENCPELKESEDERIRKEIINIFHSLADGKIPVPINFADIFTWLKKQGEKKHLELKAGHWYVCHRAYCCRADSLTVKEGEKFQCEKDGIVKGFIIKEPEKYFKECSAPATTECNYIGSDDARRRSTIQVLEYARSLDAYNQFGKADIDKNIAWLEKQGNVNALIQEAAEKSYTEGMRVERKRWLENQGEQKPIDKIQLGKKYKCIASPRYSTFRRGNIYKPVDNFLCNLMNLCYECFEPIEDSEQKPADNVEPKFHEGNFVVDNCGYVWKIEGVINQFYILEGIDGCESRPTIEYIDKTCHLWTIQDAKDGDVLACPLPKGYENREQIFIFKGINSRDYVDNCIEYYCRICDGVFYENENGYMGTTSSPIYPATKEQRDTLFAKMHEAGYEWDAEKKELKVIEQKPAWSEEDEEYLRRAINATKDAYPMTANWLKSLKQRVGG